MALKLPKVQATVKHSVVGPLLDSTQDHIVTVAFHITLFHSISNMLAGIYLFLLLFIADW